MILPTFIRNTPEGYLRLKPISFFLFVFFLPGLLLSQVDFRKDAGFFRNQEQEFQHWLEANELHLVFRTNGLDIQSDKVTVFLTYAGEAPRCDFLQNAWESAEKVFNKEHHFEQLFHEKLLDTWSVLTELSPKKVEIIVRCADDGLFNVRIFGESDGRILAEENDRKAMGNGTIPIPFEGLKEVYTGGHLDSLARKLTVRKVRLAVADYLLNQWYKGKGTSILYNVRIDTLNSYFTEFTWEFSRLSNEVLEDGYFEYHRIHIQVQERNDKLELSWQFTGKYGSGILFPPRKNDYKLMETYYKEELENYEKTLFKKITEFLQKQL